MSQSEHILNAPSVGEYATWATNSEVPAVSMQLRKRLQIGDASSGRQHSSAAGTM